MTTRQDAPGLPTPLDVVRASEAARIHRSEPRPELTRVNMVGGSAARVAAEATSAVQSQRGDHMRNGPVVTRQRDIAAIARLLGHGGVLVHPNATGSKWVADCVCGWRGTGMFRQAEAVSAARYHLSHAVQLLDRDARAAGITFNEALSNVALSDQELRELDDEISMRFERHAEAG